MDSIRGRTPSFHHGVDPGEELERPRRLHELARLAARPEDAARLLAFALALDEAELHRERDGRRERVGPPRAARIEERAVPRGVHALEGPEEGVDRLERLGPRVADGLAERVGLLAAEAHRERAADESLRIPERAHATVGEAARLDGGGGAIGARATRPTDVG